MKDELRIKILFVCTFNQMRSRTAEELYQDDERFIARSAGTDKDAPVRVDLETLMWADVVVVMETTHQTWIKIGYPLIYEKKKVLCLDIPDMYLFMQKDLIALMKKKFESLYREEIAPNAQPAGHSGKKRK